MAAVILCGCEDKTPPTWDGDGLLEATVDGTSIRLNWPTASEDGTLREHRILCDGDEVGTVNGDVREYLIEDLDDATTYELTVEAIDEAGNSSEPLHATATTDDETGPHWIAGAALRIEGEPPPEAIEGAEGEESPPAVQRGAAVLEWDAAEDEGGVASYRLMAGETELATVQGMRHELGRPLEAGERETFAVFAVDAAGNESAPLRWRAEGSTLTAPTAEAPALVEGELQVPQIQLADPTVAMPRLPSSAKLSPSNAAIIERVRRMGIRPRNLEQLGQMLAEPQAQ